MIRMKLELRGKTKEEKAFRRGLCIGGLLLIACIVLVSFGPRLIFPGTFDLTYRVSFDGEKTHGVVGLVGVHRVTVTDDTSRWGAAKYYEVYVYYYDEDVLQSFNGFGWVNELEPMVSQTLEGLSEDYSWIIEHSLAVPKPETDAAVYIELIGYDRPPSVMAMIMFEYRLMCYMY